GLVVSTSKIWRDSVSGASRIFTCRSARCRSGGTRGTSLKNTSRRSCPESCGNCTRRPVRFSSFAIFAFNARRERVGFGRQQVADDEAFVRQFRLDALRLLASWKERCDRAHLV